MSSGQDVVVGALTPSLSCSIGRLAGWDPGARLPKFLARLCHWQHGRMQASYEVSLSICCLIYMVKVMRAATSHGG